MKKNIIIIVKYFFPVAAGIETNIMETYSELAKSGWNVNLHTTTDTLTEHNILKKEEAIRGIHVHRWSWHFFGFFPKLHIPDHSLICLHNFNITPHFFFMLKSIFDKGLRKKNYSLILTPHGGFTPEWSTFPLLQRVIKSFYHRTFGVLLINASVDGVRAVSQWEKNEMISNGVKKELVSVMSNGIENMAFEDIDDQVTTEMKEKVAGYGKYLIQIGRIHTIKNFETTIKALAKLPQNIFFLIVGPVGEPEYKKKLVQLIQKLGLNNRVIFYGVARGAEKYYLIKHAQMMVHMAIWESYCNVVHEGMSQGLVCIVSNNTALPLLIKHKVNGYCLPTKDVAKLTNQIQYVLKNKQSAEIKKIEKENILEVREHSWSSVAKKMDAWYTSIIKK